MHPQTHFFVKCVFCILTHRAVDACVLVVAEEEALFAAALVAAHCVDTSVLAPTIIELAFIHIYRTADRSQEQIAYNTPGIGCSLI